MEPITLTIEGARAYTGLGKTKVFELIESGHFETIKVGRRTLIKVDSIKRFVANGGGPDA